MSLKSASFNGALFCLQNPHVVWARGVCSNIPVLTPEGNECKSRRVHHAGLFDPDIDNNYAFCMVLKDDFNVSVAKVFTHYKLGEVKAVKRIPAGFTNQVYSVNDEYILKSCSNPANEPNFKQEIYFYNLFKGKIPVPRILAADDSKTLFPTSFMIYKKIDGQPLFNVWHLLSDDQRADYVRQICEMLKVINQEPVDAVIDWYKKQMDSINALIETVESRKILSAEFITSMRAFVVAHHDVLKPQKLGLTYWDMHFDNVIVSDGKVVGLLDFEGVEVMSIDYALDTVRRLTYYPQIYASEHSEKKIKDEDYTKIYSWFKQFYPELFAFEHIERRLDLYDIEYDLELLLGYPDSDGLKKRLAETIAR